MKNNLIVILSFIVILSSFVNAEANTIKGQIVDSGTGRALEGANIVLEGTTIGTTSNQQGKFIMKNVPAGNFMLIVTYIGYEPIEKKISLTKGVTISLEIELKPTILQTQDVTVTAEADANRAIVRESPVAFTTLNKEEISMKYTTCDLPELIKDVPGVWTSTAGLGETEIWIRGFGSDKIRFTVNGVQMNEPEDNTVYWSNWTGLSNVANSIQVQRGPGFSLYGSGAFGGSVHIETMGVVPQRGTIARISVGAFNMQGVESGTLAGRVANGTGTFDDVYKPTNHTYSFRYNSGPVLNGKLNWSFMMERKAGDSYILGTDYDGYAFGFEAQSVLGNHKLSLSFIGAPQMHNQAFAFQDIDLLETLGREYNRTNHKWQENYYFKPLLHFKDEWNISNKNMLVNSLYFSYGKGADQSLTNGTFNVETGEHGFQPISLESDFTAFLRHADYLYKNYDIWTTGYHPGWGGSDPPTFKGFSIDRETHPDLVRPANFYYDQYNHSWQSKKLRDHIQFGLLSYLNSKLKTWLHFVIGGETSFWQGHRTSEICKLRVSNELPPDQPAVVKASQPYYDYDTEIVKYSTFGRVSVKPWSFLTLQAGGQFYFTYMRVIENPIRIFDFGTFKFMDIAARTSADQLNEYGSRIFDEDDYNGNYYFFTPWLGTNVNLTKKVNLFMNFATAKKEPSILNWYDPYSGPKLEQNDKDGLKPESVYSIESGFGYTGVLLEANVNYYYTNYEDKIESVVDINDRYTTMNAGQAVFQGIECEVKAKFDRFDFAGSAMIARNRWKKMGVQQIFGTEADEVVDKVVPFSPEQTLTASLGYNYEPYRIGLKVNWWDEYYGTYTNKYTKADGTIAEAKLPYFFDIGLQFSYRTRIKRVGITFRIDLNNITNRADNFMRAQYTIDHTRNDVLVDKYHWYVLQAPLINAFFTTEFTFH